MVFIWGGIAVGKLHRADLVGVGEEIHWLVNLLDLKFGDFVHLLEFLNVSCDF